MTSSDKELEEARKRWETTKCGDAPALVSAGTDYIKILTKRLRQAETYVNKLGTAIEETCDVCKHVECDTCPLDPHAPERA